MSTLILSKNVLIFELRLSVLIERFEPENVLKFSSIVIVQTQ